jgi:hypothetical protein
LEPGDVAAYDVSELELPALSACEHPATSAAAAIRPTSITIAEMPDWNALICVPF